MTLIIKVTGMCNFACTFCSAALTPINLSRYKKVPDKIVDVINTVKPDSIVISGGDPLLVEPSYYYHLHEICKCHISITSNLKDFYHHPDKWKDLFNEPWIGVCTSFQYGSKRLWDNQTIYTEEMFIEVFNLFYKYTGKKLEFIAVIDEDNEDTVMDLCRLAKRLETKVKINNAIQNGLQGSTYPKYKMYQHYINIIESGYKDYESYCSDIKTHICPFNTEFMCENCIRVCYIDKQDELHYLHCDHEIGEETPLDYKNDTLGNITKYPELKDHITDECWSCDLFSLCHGCKAIRHVNPPEHCQEMKKLKDKLIELGWVKKGLI